MGSPVHSGQPQHATRVVEAVADKQGNERKPNAQESPWKTLAFFSGATMQLGICVVVFGYFGRILALRWHHTWIMVIGVFFGVLVGASGLAYLAKQILGDK